MKHLLKSRYGLQARYVREPVVAKVELGDTRHDVGHVNMRQRIVGKRRRLESKAALQALRHTRL